MRQSRAEDRRWEPGSEDPPPARRARFHDFELDLATADLRRVGVPVPLQPQVAEALVLLVARAPRLVPREDLIRHLWPSTIVDYDQGLNNTIRLLRRALGDDPKSPRFIATLPRRGYRFLAPVELVAEPVSRPVEPAPREAEPPAPSELPGGRLPARTRWWLSLALAAAALAVAIVSLWLAAAGRRPEPPTLAVLPFAGSGPETELLGESLAEELTRELSVVPGGSLQVIGQGSAVRAGDDSADPFAAGRLLGASHVVVGSVSDEGTGLSLEVAVLRVADGSRLWRETVRTSWQELLTTPRALAGRVADSVGWVVGAGPEPPPEALSPDAVEGYLRAKYLMGRSRPEAALPLLREVVATAPTFAPARVALGDAMLSSAGGSEGAAEARRLAIEALGLAPASAEAHLLRARVALGYEWDWQLAEAHLDRARELAAGSAKVHLARAAFLSSLGRHHEALEAAELGRRLDPLSAALHGDLALLRFWAGDWAGVQREAERLLDLEPEDRMALGLRLEALVRQGRWEPARELALSLHGPDPALEVAGPALGRRLLTLQEERLRQADPGPARAIFLASLAAQRGREREALDHLEEAVRLRSAYVPFLPTDPHLADLVPHAEFQRLLAAVHHPLAKPQPSNARAADR